MDEFDITRLTGPQLWDWIQSKLPDSMKGGQGIPEEHMEPGAGLEKIIGPALQAVALPTGAPPKVNPAVAAIQAQLDELNRAPKADPTAQVRQIITSAFGGEQPAASAPSAPMRTGGGGVGVGVGSTGVQLLDPTKLADQAKGMITESTKGSRAALDDTLKAIAAQTKNVQVIPEHAPGSAPVASAFLSGLAGLGATLGRIAGSQRLAEAGQANQDQLDAIVAKPFLDALSQDKIYKLPAGASKAQTERLSQQAGARKKDLEEGNREALRTQAAALTQVLGLDAKTGEALASILNNVSTSNLQAATSMRNTDKSTAATMASASMQSSDNAKRLASMEKMERARMEVELQKAMIAAGVKDPANTAKVLDVIGKLVADGSLSKEVLAIMLQRELGIQPSSSLKGN